MENSGKYEYDDWVGRVRPDPKNTDQLTVLQGYLGASSEAGHIRVYTDESLNSFVEVPEDAILYSVKMTPAESSLGGSKIWLRTDAVVIFGDPKLANRPKSTFLEGDIMQQYGAFGQPDTSQMGGGGFMMGGQPDTSGQADTSGLGAGAMATALAIQCSPQPKSVITPCFLPTIVGVNCPKLKTLLPANTCIKSICGPCFGGITKQFFCQPPCLGATKLAPTVGGCPSAAGCPSNFCNPGGGFGQPGGGFMTGGQADTSQMGGYYGTFNPYMY